MLHFPINVYRFCTHYRSRAISGFLGRPSDRPVDAGCFGDTAGVYLSEPLRHVQRGECITSGKPSDKASEKAKLTKLKQMSFFIDTSERDLRQIAAIVSERRYDPGDVIIEENSEAEAFFLIHRGKIQISTKFEDGEEFVLGVYSDGEFFGEMAILDEGPRSATARAVEPTTVLLVSYGDFERLLHAAPQIAYAIMKELSTRLRETGALLVWQLTRKNRELAEAYLDTVRTIVHAVEERDSFLQGHSERVARLAMEIGRQMKLPDSEIRQLELGGLLHDVGMVSVSGDVVGTPRTFTDAEYEQVKKHPDTGRRMIEDVPYLRQAIPHVLYHHERFDGGGYPAGLSGGRIPLAGRIIAVADVFDALTQDRPHRSKLDVDAATEVVKNSSGTAFDPDVVTAFIQLSPAAGLPGIHAR